MPSVRRFLATEASSGVALLAAALVALLWANSPWSGTYDALWATPLGLFHGSIGFERELRWWVNDGLMTIFFFVVGLEIRRELHHGELSELRRAALPLAAALGGMLVPAALYLVFNAGHASARGWGVPMATDIAFAVGVLALLGKRVAPALRILLLSLAVVDDVGAILVIAAFYTEGIHLAPLAGGALALLTIPALQAFGARSPLLYVPSAFAAWACVYASGVHPTIAGVLIGLLTPMRTAGDEAPPVERLLHAFHGWVAYLIMPLFALANAGVSHGTADFSGVGWRIFAGIFVGLLAGKALGIVGTSRLAVATGVATAPRGVGWPGVTVVGLIAGIGFTMALFIAQLAFPPGPHLETAKLAILAASGCAGVGGFLLGRGVLSRPAEAEGSTEG